MIDRVISKKFRAKNSRKTKPVHIAAIDIGSNAMRALIVTCTPHGIKTIRDIREPLRLGEDVFKRHQISNSKIKQTEEAFINLLNVFAQMDVTVVDAVATSAMREASNGQQIINNIYNYTGINIRMIEGKKEAELVFKAVKNKMDLSQKTALLIDIGGGSTEVIISADGKILDCHSYKMGTVRLLGLTKTQLQEKLDQFAKEVLALKKRVLGDQEIDLCIGTGGNLRRMGKLRTTILYANSNEVASLSDIRVIHQTLIETPIKERITHFEMRPDRADVILPATKLIDTLLTTLKLPKIYLPKVGLKDGVLLDLLEREELI